MIFNSLFQVTGVKWLIIFRFFLVAHVRVRLFEEIPRWLGGTRRSCRSRFTIGIPYRLRDIPHLRCMVGSNPAFV